MIGIDDSQCDFRVISKFWDVSDQTQNGEHLGIDWLTGTFNIEDVQFGFYGQ